MIILLITFLFAYAIFLTARIYWLNRTDRAGEIFANPFNLLVALLVTPVHAHYWHCYMRRRGKAPGKAMAEVYLGLAMVYWAFLFMLTVACWNISDMGFRIGFSLMIYGTIIIAHTTVLIASKKQLRNGVI